MKDGDKKKNDDYADYGSYLAYCHDLHSEYTEYYDDPWIGADERYESKSVRIYRNRYLEAIKKMEQETGFNTLAPAALYEKAKEHSKKLRDNLSRTKEADVNKVLLDQADWALFQKLDFDEARKNLNKMIF